MTRSRGCAAGSSTPTTRFASSWTRRTGRCLTRSRRTGSSRASSTPTCRPRAPAAAARGDLARGRRRLARGARAARRGAAPPLRHGRAATPARAAAPAVPRPSTARRRRHGARLRRHPDDRAVRRADARRYPPRRLRARRLRRPHRVGRRAADQVRHHRGLPRGAAAVDALAGTLGSGKTIAAELLAYQAARRGSLVVDVDPKPDHNLEGLPELDGRVHVIELAGDDRYRGLLDPLVVAPEGLREDLASSYLTELLPQRRRAGRRRSARRSGRARDRSAELPARARDARGARKPEARAAGEALAVWADSGIARLAFGDGARARVAAAAAGDDDQGARAEPARPRGRRARTTTRPSGSGSPR